MIPVTSGPAECPISIVEESAPIDAPICSFCAISATYALVATVESDMPRPNAALTKRTVENPVVNGIKATELPSSDKPCDDLDALVETVSKLPEERLGPGNDQHLHGKDNPRKVRANAPGSKKKGKKCLERPERKVGCHIDKGSGTEPGMGKEYHKT